MTQAPIPEPSSAGQAAPEPADPDTPDPAAPAPVAEAPDRDSLVPAPKAADPGAHVSTPKAADPGAHVSTPKAADPGALVSTPEAPSTLAALQRGRHPSSMVSRSGWITRMLLGGIFASVVFARHCIDNIRDAEQRGGVVFVMKTRSLLDYLYFNFAFEEQGLRLARYANGVRTWSVRPFFSALGALFRGTRGLPSGPRCMALLATEGQSATLFLRRKAGTGTDADSIAHLRELVTAQRSREEPLLLLPKLLLWEKRPERARPTLLDEVFGTRHSPGFFKKLLYVAQNLWESFLRLGAPAVQVGSSINLAEWVRERAERSDHAIAAELHDRLMDGLQREERVVVGPWVKDAGLLRQEILADPRTREALDDIAVRNDLDRSVLIRQSNDILREIGADYNLLAIKFFNALLTPLFQQIYDGIEIDHEGLERLRRAAADRRIVLVPSHKSHIDYLLLSYVFYQNGLITPHIAAGVNLDFWPAGFLFRRSGAFFLRRSFADDPLYGVLFNAYLVKLFEEGFALEFFIEGTRSRTGKLNAPRYGMLNMIVEAFRSGDVDSLSFVPVSIGYEKIIEGNSYRRELEGGEKSREGIGGLLKTPAILRSRYGRVHVEFGEFIDLGSFLDAHLPDHREEPRAADLSRTVRRLAYRITHQINQATTVTPSAIAALVILNHPGRAIERETFLRNAGFVLQTLQDQGARLAKPLRDALSVRLGNVIQVNPEADDPYEAEFLSDSGPQRAGPDWLAIGSVIEAPLQESLRLLQEDGLVRIQRSGDQELWAVPGERRLELAYYKNNIVHFFVPQATLAVALLATPEGPAEHDALRESVQFLSSLLKFEFCFEERDRFPHVFAATLDHFDEEGWITRIEGRIERTANRPLGPLFFASLIRPTLETYALTADVLLREGHDWIDSRALGKRILTEGRARYLRGDLRYAEALAQPVVDNALRILRVQGLAEARQQGKKKETRVEPDALEARLPALAATLHELAGLDTTGGRPLPDA